MNPGLTEMNLGTMEPESSLAKSWDHSEDFRTWTFHLRKGLKWSDGHPFTADDVIFTMELINDPELPSAAQDALSAGEISWKKLDEFTVQADLKQDFVSFLRVLDGPTAAILPKHKWEKAYREGTFAETMQVNMDPADYVTLGAFTLGEYKPAQYLKLKRNPYYWKVDQEGKRLPYLDEIIFLTLASQDQIFLKMQSGELDTFYTVRPEDVEQLQQKTPSTGLKVIKVGPSHDSEGLWFNMNAGRNPKNGKPYVDATKRSWFSDLNFRRAVSHAINRDNIVQNAYYGKAVVCWGPESVSNTQWYTDNLVRYPYSPEKALELLKESGFVQKTDSAGKPKLYDKKGNHVRFSLNTNSGNSLRGTQCQLIASDLAKLGMQVEFSSLEFGTLVTTVTSTFDYDAMLLGLSNSDPDPTGSSNIWLSSGSLHFWWPEQKSPATTWEKKIDELMMAQSRTYDPNERKKFYDEVQYILTDMQPMIYTINQIIYVAAKEKIGNLKPTITRHRTLWNGDELYWE
jgi:peptide/nickel transport system substrate-binding protein